MKKSKRIAAFIASVLMTVTVFSGAVPTYASGKTGNFKCNNKTAYCMGSTENSDQNASALTFSIEAFDYLYVYILGNQQDKDGYNTKYVSDSSNSSITKNPRNSGSAKIGVTSNSVQFVKVVSTHIAQDGSDEQVKLLQVK